MTQPQQLQSVPTSVCACGHELKDHDWSGCVLCDAKWIETSFTPEVGIAPRCPVRVESRGNKS